MGLSPKQVSSDSLDWMQNLLLQNGGSEPPKPSQARQQQQQQTPPLECPRCHSTNTKFCYYNNYNRSQPRHFCKSCRRHWTKGGTLRNVPVGGGRKNKRLKTAATTSHQNTTTTTTTTTNTNMASQHQQPPQQQQLPPALVDQKNISEILYRALHTPLPQLPQPDYINSSNSNSSSSSSLVGSLPSFPPMPQLPLFTDISPYDSEFSSSLFEQSHLYNYADATKDAIFENNMESSLLLPSSATMTTTTVAAASAPITTSNYMESGSYWNWDELGLY